MAEKSTEILKVKTFKKNIGGKEFSIETGRLANQANAAVTVRCGDTMVLATVVMGKKEKNDIDYFPLKVDYEEKFYAGGKIKGSRFIKREGRPTDEAVLTGRMVDRAIRPLFDSRMRREVQVVATVLSIDRENEPELLALIAASTALTISDIPWNGPLGALRVTLQRDKFVLISSCEERANCNLDLFVTGASAQEINMLEVGAFEVPETKVIEGIQLAQPEIQKLIDWQKEIQKEIGKEKQIVIDNGEELKNFEQDVRGFSLPEIEKVFANSKTKVELSQALSGFNDKLVKHIAEKYPDNGWEGKAMLIADKVIDEEVHKIALTKNARPDGRGFEEVRGLQSEIDLLPRVHGSAMFLRGMTQALTTVTLGSPSDEQLLDTMTENKKKHFMHHYNFPPYSVGEVGRIGGSSRREIGHSAIAEKAISKVLPLREDFPYTIRLVSEILSSNGSSSMASTCGSSLALMAAGVPIKTHVAGIAMGLMSDQNGNYKILTDIQGPEDHYGDMDCKVAGTERGLTALQMDVKIKGVTLEILGKTFLQAKKARQEILANMEKTIAEPKKEVSQFAPIIISFFIDPKKIKDVIGSGGKTINEIIDETGVAIDIEDDGHVFVTSTDREAVKKAEEWIRNLTREVKEGEVFQGIVKRIMTFGAFVEVLPKQEGLVHISELADHRVEKVEDVVNIGDVVDVRVKEIDKMGRINLSMRNIKK